MQLKTDRFLPALDQRVVDLVAHEHGCFLAGGALRACLTDDEQIIDYDLFFTHAQAAEGAKQRLVDHHNAKMVFNCPEGKLTTYMLEGDIKVQCITEMWWEIDMALDMFDINACRYAFDGFRVFTKYSAVRDTLKKQITLHRVNYPNASMKRIAKYIQKGYKLTNKAVDQFVDRIYTAGAENEFLDQRFYID